MIIYKATNKENGMAYIGQTIRSLNSRIVSHLSGAKFGDNNYFHSALLKYGKKNFKWEVLCVCKSLKELSKKEKELINKFKTLYPYGYNLTVGGNKSNQNTKGHRLTEEHKKKISESEKGKIASEETKRKMSKSRKKYLKNHPHSKGFLGKHHSEKTKQKLSMISMGNQNAAGRRSEESKQKMSESKKGKNNPMYGKRGKNNPNYNSKRTEKTKQKMSKSIKKHFKSNSHPKGMLGKTHTKKTKRKMSMAQKRRYKEE